MGCGIQATPFWVGNNGSGTVTLYGGTGNVIPLVVTIPQAGNAGTAGPVTAVVFNSFASNTNAFDVQSGKPALFIFCSEDGVISGWNQSVKTFTSCIPLRQLQNRPRQLYTGCALGGTAAAPISLRRTSAPAEWMSTTPASI